MATTVKAQLKEVYLVRLEAGDDLLLAIRQAARDNDIKTGVILDITGGMTNCRVQKFKEVGPPLAHTEIVEIPGPMEVSGHGIIGLTQGNGGTGNHKDGQPYVHCHLNITSAEQTLCGHLMEGCFVRSSPGKSHFTIVLASFSGALLTMVAKSGTGPGVVHHELEQL